MEENFIDYKMPKILITRKECSKILNICESSLHKIPDLELPKIRIGKSVRYRISAIENYILKKEKNNV